MCDTYEEAQKCADENIELIARVCHEANRALCEAQGDNSQPRWEDAAEWQKESAKNGVLYRLENPDALPEDQHNAWMKEKIDAGWIWGEVKDAEKKTHPCIVPYEELPFVQQTKDYLYCAVCDTLLDLYFPADDEDEPTFIG